MFAKGDGSWPDVFAGHVEVATLDGCNVDASFAECWPELQKIERLARWLLCDLRRVHSLCEICFSSLRLGFSFPLINRIGLLLFATPCLS